MASTITETKEPVMIPKPYIANTAAIIAPLRLVLAISEVMIADKG
jgi:hypothetical protein